MPLAGSLWLAADHPALHFDGAAHCVDDTREFHQHTVAGILYAKQYFNGINPDETTIRSLADAIFKKARGEGRREPIRRRRGVVE